MITKPGPVIVVSGGRPTTQACAELFDAISEAIEDHGDGMSIAAIIGVLEIHKADFIRRELERLS